MVLVDRATDDINPTLIRQQAAAAAAIQAAQFAPTTPPVNQALAGSGKVIIGSRGSRTTVQPTGTIYIETDTEWVYYSTGSQWKFETGLRFGTDAQRAAVTPKPAGDDDGAPFFATDTLVLWQVVAHAWAKKLQILGTANEITVGIGAGGIMTLSLPGVAGWSDPTGAHNRNTFDPATVTLTALAQFVSGMYFDLKTQNILHA